MLIRNAILLSVKKLHYLNVLEYKVLNWIRLVFKKSAPPNTKHFSHKLNYKPKTPYVLLRLISTFHRKNKLLILRRKIMKIMKNLIMKISFV